MDQKLDTEIDYRRAKGFLSIAERECLFEIARNVSSDVSHPFFLNIGVEYGASLACLRSGRPEADILGIDIDISKAVSHYGARLVESPSSQYLKEFDPKWTGMALVFVDGDHGYEGVLIDTGFANHVWMDGYIIFHDCYNWPPDSPKTIHHKCPGINKAVEEWHIAISGKIWEELEPVDSMRIFKRVG